MFMDFFLYTFIIVFLVIINLNEREFSILTNINIIKRKVIGVYFDSEASTVNPEKTV